MKPIDCHSLIEAIRNITNDGTKIWLFDVPPYEPETESYEKAEEVNDMGVPITKRTITGTLGKRANIVEKDKGFGTYRKWDADHTSYDIKAITREQNTLKQITMAALTTKNIYRFGKKAKHLINPITAYKFNGEFLSTTMDEDAKDSWIDLLDEIRHQCHMTLMMAITMPELKDKAKLYWDILKQSDNEAFDRSPLKVQQEIKGSLETTTKQIDLPAIVPPEGWNMN